MKTLADCPEVLATMRDQMRHPEEFDPAHPNPEAHLRTPCCHRWMPACCLVDLRGIETIIRGGNYLPARDHDFACTDCVHLMILSDENDWNYPNLWTALGAPDEWVRDAIAKHLRAAERADDWAHDRLHYEHESYQRHYDSVKGMDPKAHPLAQPPRRTR